MVVRPLPVKVGTPCKAGDLLPPAGHGTSLMVGVSDTQRDGFPQSAIARTSHQGQDNKSGLSCQIIL